MSRVVSLFGAAGGVLDLSEASRRYHDESEFPVMVSACVVSDVYFVFGHFGFPFTRIFIFHA